MRGTQTSMTERVQRAIKLADPRTAGFVYGKGDSNLKVLRQVLDVQLGARGSDVTIAGDPKQVDLAAQTLEQLYAVVAAGRQIEPRDVRRAIDIVRHNPGITLKSILLDTILVTSRHRVISPKGVSQKLYVDAIRNNDVVFGIGPAGTGKTYLAMAMALAALTRKQVRRVILTRPAVEAGEKLGFLPGDLQEKVNPYLRPLYDALFDMLEHEKATEYIEKGAIEVAPLAFMRGRTLNDCFVILDEAQNTTKSQMKMFLTRLGYDSKAVITGDITQIDLERKSNSGLVDAHKVLRGVKGIEFSEFKRSDVVRHHLVMKIIAAYDKADAHREAKTAEAKGSD